MDFINQLHIATPEVIVVVGAMVMLLLGAYGGDKARPAVSLLSGLILVGAAAASAVGPLRPVASTTTASIVVSS